MGKPQCHVHICLSGTSAAPVVAKRWKMIPSLDGLPQQKLLTTSAKWMSLCKVTADWPCALWQKSWTLTTNWFTSFCQRSLACTKCAPRWCPSFSQMIRSSIVSGFAKTRLKKLEQIQIFFATLSLEIKLGCSSTTWKPRGRASSGWPQIHQDPRKHACQSQRSRPCWSLSLTKRVWCIMSLCLRAKRWTSTFIRKSSNTSMTGFAAADQLFGKTSLGCSTMTTRLHTPHSAHGSCWPTSRLQC